MKNTVITFLLLIGLSVTVFGQKPVPEAQQASYTIDFVFAGESRLKGDSVFALEYTFAPADVQLFTRLVLEDSQGQHPLNLRKTGSQGDMEVRNEKDKVKVLVHRYDKFDLPVLTLGEDKQGVKHPLCLKTNTGKLMSSEQFKAQIKGIRESVRQREKAGSTN